MIKQKGRIPSLSTLFTLAVLTATDIHIRNIAIIMWQLNLLLRMLQTSCQSQCTGLSVNNVNLKSKILRRVLSCIMTPLTLLCKLYIDVQPACSGIG